MPHKRPNEPIAPATIPGQRLDPKIPPEQRPEADEEREAPRQQPDRDSGPAPLGLSSDLPAIETPVIQSQDLEHASGLDTRVNNSGVKVEPLSDAQRRKDDAQFVKEDAKAREAVADFERTLETLPPE